jgi:parvulin-like peptidyl-prolyl isomerase
VALVAGQPISLAEFQEELARYQTAAGTAGLEPTQAERERVLNELIDTLLLAQGAAQQGYQPDEAALQARYDRLAGALGGQQGLENWIAANGYTKETFQQALRRSIQAAWMRDAIAAAVPLSAEQVYARQIMHYNAEDAGAAWQSLQAGTDFATLAEEVDPAAAGDLGWFPRGYLFDPNLEEAAFALQPGEYSQVIETLAGFVILQVIEREAQRPLTSDALLTLQAQAVQTWLADRRLVSNIQIMVPLGSP